MRPQEYFGIGSRVTKFDVKYTLFIFLHFIYTRGTEQDMKEVEVSKAPPWAAARLLMAPATAPTMLTPHQQQQEELSFLRDKRYAFHGQITLLVLFAIFFIFICIAAVYPCLKRVKNTRWNVRSSVRGQGGVSGSR